MNGYVIITFRKRQSRNGWNRYWPNYGKRRVAVGQKKNSCKIKNIPMSCRDKRDFKGLGLNPWERHKRINGGDRDGKGFFKSQKEELYRALEQIDDNEWKPFMAWCGGRTAEFGEWADRLGISTYTRQVDNYQNRVQEINDSTRNQMDIAFEGAAETDRRYAQIFQGHAETVREQIRRVQTMLQVMQSANRNGTDIGTLTDGKLASGGFLYGAA